MKNLFATFFFVIMFLGASGFSKEPTLGETAPAFHTGTALGEISFPDDFLGLWTLLIGVPNIMTIVCTLELTKCLEMTQEWRDLHTRCLVLTCHESVPQQHWLETTLQNFNKNMKIDEKDLPLLIPDPKRKIANLYGMIHSSVTKEKPIRAVFVIDPKGKIRFISFYPMKNGRNFEEIARIIAAMQKTDEDSTFVTSPDWEMGDEPTICVPCSQLKK